MKRLLLALVVVLLAVPVQAAYITATTATTAEVTGDGRLKVSVAFAGDSGEATITREFVAGSLSDLQRLVSGFLAQLNQVTADAATLKAGTAIGSPTPTLPTMDQAIQQATASARAKYAELAGLVNLGALDPADATVTAALANVQAIGALRAMQLAIEAADLATTIGDLGGAVSVKPAPLPPSPVVTGVTP